MRREHSFITQEKNSTGASRDLRSKALTEIASVLDIPGTYVDIILKVELHQTYYLNFIAVGEVDKKKKFRTQYSREKANTKSRDGANDIYEPKWIYVLQMSAVFRSL